MAVKKNLSDLAREARDHGVQEVDADELALLIEQSKSKGEGEQPMILDVREPDERRRGHIPESVHVPRGVLERDIEKKAFGGQASDQDLGRPIVCYCGGGSRSLLACEALGRMGFTDIRSLTGGFKAWGEGGGPVEVER